MKKIFALFIFTLLFSYLGSAQDIILDIAKTDAKSKHKAPKTRNTLSIGASYGFDKNINAFRSDINKYGNTFHNDKLYNNISLDFGIYATKKLRTRIEFKYVTMGYSADWDSTGVSTMKETVVNMYNFNINFHMDYILLSIKKFDLALSPSAKYEFTSGHAFYNERYDGTQDYKNYYKIIDEYPKNAFAVAIAGIVKYNITKHIGVTLTPEYTYFFKKFAKTNDKNYQRMSINAGLEFAF